jgi:hypothetical protein
VPRKYDLDVAAADKRRTEFHQALGEFILEFANMEKTFLEVFFGMAKVSRDVATSVFSGLHIDTIKDFIKRIIEAEATRGTTTDYSLLVDALDQLGHITRVRNDILHHGLQFWVDDDPLFNNRLVANVPRRIREYRISTANICDMTSDLHKMWDHILLQFPPRGARILPHVLATVREPWRYKPPVQSGPPREPRDSNPKRRGQRQPSRG